MEKDDKSSTNHYTEKQKTGTTLIPLKTGGDSSSFMACKYLTFMSAASHIIWNIHEHIFLYACVIK
jgi:hypothetical protein